LQTFSLKTSASSVNLPAPGGDFILHFGLPRRLDAQCFSVYKGLGPKRYVMKPVALKVLAETVQKALEKDVP
jgi:hypothetical protein